LNCFDCIALEEFAAVIAIDNYHVRQKTLFPVRIRRFKHTAKRGRNGNPTLRIYLVMAFASEPLAHCPAALSVTKTNLAPGNGKRRIELLPLLKPPPSSHFWVCPTTRATWGDVCSLARRISGSMKAGACMKPDLGDFYAGF
jgi:hypothetical protein